MKKQENFDELLSVVGKPTPGAHYTTMKNPAIDRLLDYYHCDVREVLAQYHGLTVLKWINMGQADFINLVYKYADRMKAKLDRIARKSPVGRPDDEELGHEDDSLYDPEEDEGAVTVLKRKLAVANGEKKKMAADTYLYRTLIDESENILKSIQPATVTLNLTKPVKMFKGEKFYNILPISDVHWGEVIIPDHINGGNEYNFEVSMRRHKALFEKNYELAKMYNCDELNIFMLGDILAGNIHDELRESAETTICDAMARYISFFTGLLSSYAKEFKRTDVFCVVGNHARVTKEVRFKKKGIDNYEYTLYRFLDTFFRANPKLNVNVHTTESTVLFAQVGDQTWKLEHGDSYRGGTAFAAPLPSVTRDGFKDRMLYRGMGYDYQASMIGHFHIGAEHFIQGDSAPIYINPSMIGPGEYSLKTCHSSFPASSYMFITDGHDVVDKKFINLQNV